MGLSGRKEKQRIGSDPRNLSWADNAAKFGQAYLSKLGWDPSKGLGAEGDGRTLHVKVAQKLNLLGIGAGTAQGPDGVAWKQNRDYEMLLKRLNEGAKEGEEAEQEMVEAETAKRSGTPEAVKDGEDSGRKKRKRDKDVENDEEREKRKQDKKEKKRKEKKRRPEDKVAKDKGPSKLQTDESVMSTTLQPMAELAPAAFAPRPMAHRARFLRSKQLASQSSIAVAEILGVASGTSSPSLSESTTPLPPSSTTTPSGEDVRMETLTTATKSVADYFKEKLAARAKSVSGSETLTASFSTSSPPAEGKDGYGEFDTLRRGIGSSRTASDCDGSDGDSGAPRMGLGSRPGFTGPMGSALTLTLVSPGRVADKEADGEGLGSGVARDTDVAGGGDVASGIDVADIGPGGDEEMERSKKVKKDKKDKKSRRREEVPVDIEPETLTKERGVASSVVEDSKDQKEKKTKRRREMGGIS